MAVNKLQLKRSAVAGKEPTTSSLALGELAINTYEGKVFLKKDDGVETIVQLADVSGSIFSASYAQTSSHSDKFTVTGPVDVYGSQYISGSLVVGNDITAQRLVVQTVTSSVIYSSGSNIFGDATSDTQTFTGSVNISGSLSLVGNQVIDPSYSLDVDTINVNTITDRNGGTLTLGASTSSISGFLTVNNNISSSGNVEAVSFTGSFSGSINNLQGTATHIPYFSSSQVLADSAMYQIGSSSIAINQTGVTSAAPEALYVWQPSDTSFNVISGKGNLDDYLQLNIQNTNQGVSASSDVVATANNGDENNNYINMGINSENFNGPIGEGNDAYLYSTGNNLHIGNTKAGKHLGFFVGGDDAETDKKLQLNPTGHHQMTGSLDIDSQVTASRFVTRGATAAQFVKGDGSLDSTLYTSASVFNNTTSSLQAFSASMLAFTASTLVNSASFDTRINYLSSSFEFATASLNAFSSSMLNFTASQKDANGTFATTGSNTFNGDQTINGSIILDNGAVIKDNSNNSVSFGYLAAETNQGTQSVAIGNGAGYQNQSNQGIAIGANAGAINQGQRALALGSLAGSNTQGEYAIAIGNFAAPNNQASHSIVISAIGSGLENTTPNSLVIAPIRNVNGDNGVLQYNTTTKEVSYATTLNGITNLATTGSNIFKGNQTITGSLSVSGSTNIYGTTNVTGSVNVSGSTGTAITANVDTIVYTGSYAQSGSATISGNLTVTDTITAQKLIVQTVSSSVIYSSGSNKFGNDLSNTQIFTGSVDITGSLTVNGRNYINDSSSFDTRINYLSSSFNSSTASINSFTASVNAFSASMLSTTASLNAFSSSVLSFTASALIDSASFDTRINYVSTSFEAATASLNLFSASMLSTTASVNEFSASMLSFTSSTLVNSASFDTRIGYISSSFEAATASLNLFSASILSYTSSNNEVVAKLYAETSSLLANTASMNLFSASMLSYTASNNEFVADILTETASLQAATASLNANTASMNLFSASMLSFTASTLVNSGSFDTRINYLSSSFEANTASINLFTASFNAFSSSILNTTASVNAFSASMLSFTASQKDLNGTLATTGSNTFIGNQVISGSTDITGSLSLTGSQNIIGNLTVTDTITAQKLVVQFITSSVIQVTGSTKFGDEVTDTHQFTGSVSVSGSLVVNGRDYITDSGSFDKRINYVSSSFEAATASLNAFSASILSYTASNNEFVADMLTETASLQAATASLNLFSASVLNFTASTLVNSASFDTRIQYISNSFEAATASINSFSSSILNYTASNNAFVADMLLETASLQGATGSLFNFSASILSYTASNNLFVADILLETASLQAATASLNLFSASMLDFTSSTLVNSASFDTRINYLSSSFEANTASFNAYSASFNAFSSSILNYTASNNAAIADILIETASLQAATASLNLFSASMLSFTASQEDLNGTLATTGSNTFIGDQTITGSLSVSGSTNIYGTTNVTGSVNVSGSEGTLLTTNVDTIIFTGSFNQMGSTNLFGSVDITGSLMVNGRDYTNDSSSFSTRTLNLERATASLYATSASINAFSASILSFTASQKNLNGTLATTGSNTFVDTQYISNTTNPISFTDTASLYTDGGLRVTKDVYVSGSTYIAGNLTVFGTSSIQYVTASAFIGLEFIDLNTDLPALRYAGINVGDSGSEAGITSSLLYDSQNNDWLFSHSHTGGSPTSSIVIFGPIAYNNLGNEVGITGNYLTKGQLIGGEGDHDHHITSSQIYDDGTTVSIPGNLEVYGSITGSLFGTSSYAVNANFLDGLDSTSFVSTGSFGAQTASFNAFSSSVLNYTASNNDVVAQLYAETASILSYTASAKIDSGSVSTRLVNLEAFSSSLDSTFATDADLNALSSSFIAYTASLNEFSASMLSFTASTLTNSASFDTRINYISSSFESSTVSLNNFSASILNYTASNNAFVADMLLETASLQGATASLFNFSESILNYTASNNAFVADMLIETASLQSATASLYNFSASALLYTASNDATISQLYAETASILNYTASNNVTIQAIYAETASILAHTASINAFSASINAYTSSNNDAIASLYSATASLNEFSASMLSFTASQKNSNGTFATTGSNIFEGVQTINSNLVVTGSITAQTLVVQTITSSVDFVTGSTHFGTIIDNTHQFTGSVSISGSLSVNDSNVILTNQTASMSVATASYWSGSIENAATASYAVTSSLYESTSARISSSITILPSGYHKLYDLSRFKGAMVDYVVSTSGSGASMRAGTFTSTWNNTTTISNESMTMDIGNTDVVQFSADITGSIFVNITSGSWEIDSLYRALGSN
jgi:hypothetical protein